MASYWMEDDDDNNETSRYVFMASINLYQNVFESEHGEVEFEGNSHEIWTAYRHPWCGS